MYFQAGLSTMWWWLTFERHCFDSQALEKNFQVNDTITSCLSGGKCVSGRMSVSGPRSRKWQWWRILKSPVPGAGASTSGHRDSQMLGRCLDWKVCRDEWFHLLRYSSPWVCCISEHLGSRNTDCFCSGLCCWACLYSGEHYNTERWSPYRATDRHLYYLLELLKCRHSCTWTSVLTGSPWPSEHCLIRISLGKPA